MWRRSLLAISATTTNSNTTTTTTTNDNTNPTPYNHKDSISSTHPQASAFAAASSLLHKWYRSHASTCIEEGIIVTMPLMALVTVPVMASVLCSTVAYTAM
jgi:hypothetical protein